MARAAVGLSVSLGQAEEGAGTEAKVGLHFP